LFLRSRRRAYNLAYRLTGNAADAEDVTQDAYVRAWHHFERYDAAWSFESWLFRILTNRAIDLQRHKKRVPIYSLGIPIPNDTDDQPLLYELAAPDSDPAQIVLGPILEERLEEALLALPTDYRAAILLRAVEQRSYQEIAEMTHCALGTVRSRLHRARGDARHYLETGSSGHRRRWRRRTAGPAT
jgi:RNA polymerase sigma-70 factor (ECF subfamily)